MNEPKLRFKADDGSQFPDWEKKKLSDIFVERREMQCIDDEYKLLSFTIEQGVINPEDKKTNKRDFLMKDKASKKFLRTEYNDIIYNPANLKYGAINRNKLGKGLLSPIYAIFYTEQNAVFMESIVRNPDFIKRTLKYLEGTVIKLMTLKPRDFLRMKSYIPCLEEQQKIAEFLSTIDTVIAKQKETVSAWEKRKKGVMQKLFSQEVRFKADDGSKFPDWEEKKLNEIAVRVTRKNKDNVTDIPLTISSADGLIDQRNFFNKVVASKDMSGYFLLKNGEFAYNKSYSKGYNFGSIKRLDLYDEGALSTLYICFALNKNENSDFYQKYFDSLSWYPELQKICAEGARNHGLLNVPTNDFFQLKLCVPSSDKEQHKIADCLSSLDEVIEKQKETLVAWEELKKGLLQQMFV